MKKQKLLFIIVLFIINLCFIHAIEQEGLNPDRSESGPLLIKPRIDIIGAGVLLGYKGFNFIEGRDTIIWAGAGASWKNTPFYRDFNDNLLTSDNTDINGGIDLDEDLSFYKININWTVGITQGILWNSKIKANLIDVSLFYRGRFDYHFENDEKDQVIFNQFNYLPDMEKIQQNSFIAGISLNNAYKADNIIRGFYSEVSAEWGPSFMNKIADYVRLNFGFKGFIPIIDIATKTGSNFSIYLGDYFVVDWITGDTIPLNIRQSIGGFGNQRYGLGGTVRAVDRSRYDSSLKIANCFDIRINLPIPMPLDIVPGVILYFDSAYYNEMKGADDGFLLSTGGGITFNLLERFQLTGYTGVYLNGENVNGEKWKPFTFAMSFHF